jgi:hypothetical protein
MEEELAGGVLPLRVTTTAAGSERDPQRAKASNQTRIARRRMEEELAGAFFLCE